MASKEITPQEIEAIAYGLKIGMTKQAIADKLGRDPRRVYEVQKMLRFAAANQKEVTLIEVIKRDVKRIFRKDGSKIRKELAR